MRPRRHISAAGVVVVLAVIAAVAVVTWVLVLVRGEDSPIAPTVSPTGGPTATVQATPTLRPSTPAPTEPVIPVAPPGSLPDLLRYAPDRLADGSLPLSDVAQYADIAGWMEARGIATPTGPDDPAYAAWEAELESLALPSILAARGNDPIWEQTYGFRLAAVHQVLAVGQAPDFVLILKGDFAAEQLRTAWVSNGYQAVASDNVTLWSLFPGDTIDLSAPASRPALGSFNNIVLLDDGTLVAASRISRLETMLDVIRGNERSLGENEAVAALLAPGAGTRGLASAVITKGTVLANGTPLLPATPTPGGTPPVVSGPLGTPSVAAPQMPEAGLALFGVDAPPEPDALAPMTIVLGFDDPGAATGAMRIVGRGLRTGISAVTGQPYTDRLKPIGLQIVGTGDGPALLVARAGLIHGPADWLAIVEERDLGFMTWMPGGPDE